jgi:ABC-type uncharacterized transport system fused permease/ATPase subunit
MTAAPLHFLGMSQELRELFPRLTPLDVLLVIGINAVTLGLLALALWFRASYRRLEAKLDERDVQRNELTARIMKLEAAASLVASVARCRQRFCAFREAAADMATAHQYFSEHHEDPEEEQTPQPQQHTKQTTP